jgi:hypothetical protein
VVFHASLQEDAVRPHVHVHVPARRQIALLPTLITGNDLNDYHSDHAKIVPMRSPRPCRRSHEQLCGQPQLYSGTAKPIGRFAEGLLLRLLQIASFRFYAGDQNQLVGGR